MKLQCCLDDTVAYYWNVSIHIVRLKNNDLETLKAILLILNSSLITFYAIEKDLILWAKKWSKKTPQIRKKWLDKLPILYPKDKNEWIEKADDMLTLNEEYNASLQQTLSFLQSEYWLEKIPKKLQKFTELDFDGFKKVLKLKKLSLTEKEELMTWFTNKHKTLSELQQQIDALDAEIDEMVFDLYRLSEEEREIVKNG